MYYLENEAFWTGMVIFVNLVDYQKYNTCQECKGKKDQNGYLQTDNILTTYLARQFSVYCTLFTHPPQKKTLQKMMESSETYQSSNSCREGAGIYCAPKLP